MRIYGSRTIVTGPSLTSSTAICAPKTPRATGTPSAASSSQMRSYGSSARSGGAAPEKLGRFPFAVSADAVNRTPVPQRRLCGRRRRPRRLVDHLQLDPVGVEEEGSVIAGCVVRELVRRALGLDSLREHALPAVVDCLAAERLEGDVVDTDRVSVVGNSMGIRLLLAQAQPGVLGLQIPDLFSSLADQFEHRPPAERPQQVRV